MFFTMSIMASVARRNSLKSSERTFTLTGLAAGGFTGCAAGGLTGLAAGGLIGLAAAGFAARLASATVGVARANGAAEIRLGEARARE